MRWWEEQPDPIDSQCCCGHRDSKHLREPIYNNNGEVVTCCSEKYCECPEFIEGEREDYDSNEDR